MRLPHPILMCIHRVLLDIHAATDLTQLRGRIVAGLEQLVPCDRASFNDFNIDAKLRSVAPSPVPTWWPRYAEAYRAHMMDHPVVDPAHRPPLNQTVSLEDRHHASRWRRSALNHEYFAPLGVKHQLGSLIHQRGTRFVALAVNRSHERFQERDRAVFDVVNPHFALAWSNGLRLAAARDSVSAPASTHGVCLIHISAGTGTMGGSTARARTTLQQFFGTDSSGQGRLPEPVWQWLRAQLAHRATTDAVAGPPPAPLTRERDRERLAITMARHGAEEVVLVLETTVATSPPPLRSLPKLTSREREILRWLGEGKRNVEIAMILGLSSRTVEKHVEHILNKLGSETRTAAVRQSLLWSHLPGGRVCA